VTWRISLAIEILRQLIFRVVKINEPLKLSETSPVDTGLAWTLTHITA
jgi:hypothetical protein